MTNSEKRTLLLTVTVITAAGIWLLPPIAQPLGYHDLADKRTIWGIPNFANVVSNLPFLFVGMDGLRVMRRARVGRGLAEVEVVDYRVGVGLLWPLLALGVASVWWWHWTELQGRGDLRLYGWVQYYPMLFLPLVLWLYYDPSHQRTLKPLA